jgi:hypothetical protein
MTPRVQYYYRARARQETAPSTYEESLWSLMDTSWQGKIYYVNDSSTTNDIWATAPGSSANDGLAPATPMATVDSVLTAYTVLPGDVIQVDTGYYTDGFNIGLDDAGSETSPVVIQSSPYGVTCYGRDMRLNSNYIILETAASDVHPGIAQDWAKIDGGNLTIGGDNSIVRRMRIQPPMSVGSDGIELTDNAENTLIENCIISVPGYVNLSTGINIEDCSLGVTVRNTTISGLKSGLYIETTQDAPNSVFENNIIVATSSGIELRDDFFSGTFNNNAVHSYYYAYWVTGFAETLKEWQTLKGQGENSISTDPLFVDPTSGDFHLQSTGGSYHGGLWTPDVSLSPGIDAGHGDVGDELAPNHTPLHDELNGARNLGGYGGTELASKTPSERSVVFSNPIEGEVLDDSQIDIKWNWVGADWAPGDTLALNASVAPDSYQPIPGADSIPVENAEFSWNVSAAPSGLYDIQAVGPAVSDTTGPFALRTNGPVIYYVNDSSTTNDLWTTAIGDDGNTGMRSDTPKATVQSILDTYALLPGDTIKIDTGSYDLTSPIVFGEDDAGMDASYVQLEGSPYGVTITQTNPLLNVIETTERYISISTAVDSSKPGVEQRWMKLTGGDAGVSQSASFTKLDRLEISDNVSYGVFSSNGTGPITNCLIGETSAPDGFGVYSTLTIDIRNSTIFGSNVGVYASKGYGNIIENNIMVADGVGAVAFATGWVPTTPESYHVLDYNLYYATNEASLLHTQGVYYDSVSEWNTATGLDAHSINADPRFVDPASGDYHLQSTESSYHSGLWTSDAISSSAIDTGLGDVGDELAPNTTPLHDTDLGMRNLGAYGGTEQASKTPTERSLVFLKPLGGGVITEIPEYIHWTWIGQDWTSSDVVSLKYTSDGWRTAQESQLLKRYPAERGVARWEGLPEGFADECGIELFNEYTSVVSQPFMVNPYDSTAYYVNDASITNDFWAEAPGDDANDGLTRQTPKATIQSVIDTYELGAGDLVSSC